MGWLTNCSSSLFCRRPNLSFPYVWVSLDLDKLFMTMLPYIPHYHFLSKVSVQHTQYHGSVGNNDDPPNQIARQKSETDTQGCKRQKTAGWEKENVGRNGHPFPDAPLVSPLQEIHKNGEKNYVKGFLGNGNGVIKAECGMGVVDGEDEPLTGPSRFLNGIADPLTPLVDCHPGESISHGPDTR